LAGRSRARSLTSGARASTAPPHLDLSFLLCLVGPRCQLNLLQLRNKLEQRPVHSTPPQPGSHDPELQLLGYISPGRRALASSSHHAISHSAVRFVPVYCRSHRAANQVTGVAPPVKTTRAGVPSSARGRLGSRPHLGSPPEPSNHAVCIRIKVNRSLELQSPPRTALHRERGNSGCNSR
jgi:hypothetical protein